MQDLIQQLASELDKDPRHVENVVRLLDEGNTIPFIARYRKELHGAMDDTALRNLEERLQYLRNLAERREAVKRSIEEQGKLTEELSAAIDAARTLAEVEDLYRPYKQKRRTRATIAREKGLKVQMNHISSLGSLFFTGQPVVDYVSAKTSDTKAFAEYFKKMLKMGIHMAPSQFEAMFLSAAHTDEIIMETLDAVKLVL